MSEFLTIRQVATASGRSTDTIRYYERVGVLPRVQRGGNAYRSYIAEHVETLRFARRLRELGLAPAAMSDLIRLFHDGTCGEMRDALVESAERTLAEIREQQAELEPVEAQLTVVLQGLESQSLDNDRLATVTPCVCVAVVEEERTL